MKVLERQREKQASHARPLPDRLPAGQPEWTDIAIVVLTLLAAYAVIWAFTDRGLFRPAVYHSYVLQANRWLSGHLDLGRNYSYLEIAEYGGRFYVSFPPVPSVILLPFCLLFGGSPPDTLIAVIIGLAGAVYALKMVWTTGRRGKNAVFWALFVTAGSNFLHIGFSADVWYFAQTCSFTFTMMALYYAMTDELQKGWLPFLLLALAVGCRPLQIVYLPLVAFLLWRKLQRNGIGVIDAVRRFWWWIVPPLCVGAFYMALNYARFGDVFQFGHDYLPEFAVEKPEGQFSLAYLADNWSRLWQLPPIEDGVVRFPLFNGCAFWLFSPIFLMLPILSVRRWKHLVRAPEVLLAAALIFVQFVFLCLHATMGGWQFGNRYTIDALPVLLFAVATLLGKEKSGVEIAAIPLFVWGMGVNLVGTVGLLAGWLT